MVMSVGAARTGHFHLPCLNLSQYRQTLSFLCDQLMREGLSAYL